MNEVSFLISSAVALVVAFAGGMIARRVGLPTIVGYLLAGIVIGPFTPGFVGDTETIRGFADLGIVFLMFGVGLHFSFRDLWKVRQVAIPGALGRLVLVALMGLGLSRLWGWTLEAGMVFGLAISIASTVVLLRVLEDSGRLNTAPGQAAIGWVVLEDIATVLILLVLPALAGEAGRPVWESLAITLLKVSAFVAGALFVGGRAIPWLLMRIAHTGSRELFILAILAVALGVALGAAQLLGVSLALGAFVAGVVVSESPLSLQVGADVLPFREAFAVLFFVSIGMLVNPAFLWANIGPVLAVTGLIVIGKLLVTLVLGVVFSWSAPTTLLLATVLSQIGEFSFILGETGLALGMIDRDQESLILAGAILSIVVSPLLIRVVPIAEKQLRARPRLWRMLNRHTLTESAKDETLADHVVVVGYGRVGTHIVNVAEGLGLKRLAVELDPERIEELTRKGVPTLFGDAGNSEVLKYAQLDRARALVVTTPDEATAALVVATARDLAPRLPILARASTTEGVRRLSELGAQTVIHLEMEGGLELVRHLLLELGYSLRYVYEYAEAVRQDHYDVVVNTDEEHRLLRRLIDAEESIEMCWFRLDAGSPLAGQTLLEANLRARTGASVVAIVRGRQLIPNPWPGTVLQPGDRVGLIGEQEQIDRAEELLAASAGSEIGQSGRA